MSPPKTIADDTTPAAARPVPLVFTSLTSNQLVPFQASTFAVPGGTSPLIAKAAGLTPVPEPASLT